MSTLPTHLRVAYEALERAQERVAVALGEELSDETHKRLSVMAGVLCEASRWMAQTLGELWVAGALTPADMEPPRLSAECADEEPADLEDVEAREEALLPAAAVLRSNECRECRVLKGCRHARDCSIPAEHPSPVVESDCEVTP